MKCLAGYIPGLHEGYRRFFERFSKEAEVLYVFGPDLISEFDHLRKDIRALDPSLIASAIQSWKIFRAVKVLDFGQIESVRNQWSGLIMPDEYESRIVAARYFGDFIDCGSVVFEPVFLRWSMEKSSAELAVEADRIISTAAFDREIMMLALAQTSLSIDWWRQVGAVLVIEGQVAMAAHNEPATSCHYLHLFGDPRSNFKRGVAIELSLFDHAEATMIAEAARRGLALEGASLWVTTFPCPPCAKAIARAGIKRLYFKDGYSRVDGEDVLRKHRVEIIRVELK